MVGPPGVVVMIPRHVAPGLVVPDVIAVVVPVAMVRVLGVMARIDIHVMRVPVEDEGGRHAPEEAGAERVAGRIRVVVDRVAVGVVADHGRRIVGHDARRLIVGNVDDLRVGRRDGDGAAVVADGLVVVALQVAGGARQRAELLDGLEQVHLLVDEGLAEVRRPVQVRVHHPQHFGVVEQCDDGVVPGIVRPERRVLLAGVEEARGLHHLQWVGRGGQHDAEQVVHIQCDRADERLEFGRAERRRRRRGRHALGAGAGRGQQGRHQQGRPDAPDPDVAGGAERVRRHDPPPSAPLSERGLNDPGPHLSAA